MLQNTRELYGHALAASDGDVGHVQDFYFDDKTWMLRYLVADTGSWLTGRQVLLSPHAFGNLAREEKSLHVRLTKKQIENSPPIDSHQPVSRQYEIACHRYYGWPAYWDGGAMGSGGGASGAMPPAADEAAADRKLHYREDQHLQSTRAIDGYRLQALDGEIGSVTGFMVDDKSWAIREIVAETGHWYRGKEILISPANVEGISFAASKVFVGLTMAEIERTAEHHLVQVHAGDHGTNEFPTE